MNEFREFSPSQSKAPWFFSLAWSLPAGLETCALSLPVSECVREVSAVEEVRYSGITVTVLAAEEFVPQMPVVVLGLPPGLCFFLDKVCPGGDADEGPNVKEREREEASTEPNPDPLRVCDCWSGEAAMDTV